MLPVEEASLGSKMGVDLLIVGHCTFYIKGFAVPISI
jgi:hypothetical protein